MGVRLLNGKKVDWNQPPKATSLVLWTGKTSGGKQVKGSFRTICHLNRLNALAKSKYGKGIVVIQASYNTGVKASAGTHDFDACLDVYIPGVSWWEQQRFFRANGFACWYRYPPAFGNHIHGFTLPPQEGKVRADDWQVAGFKVGKYVDGGWSTQGRKTTSAQIDDYYNRAFGLSGKHTKNSDKSWFPENVKSTIFDLDAYVQKKQRNQAAKKAGKTPTQPAPQPAPVPTEQPIKDRFTKPTIDSVDISRYQTRKIDYAAARRAGVKFMWHKVTEGDSLRDPNYDKRRKEAKAAGIPFGAYHFARADFTGSKNDARKEARFFLKHAAPVSGDVRPALDLETMEGLSLSQIRTWAKDFVAEVKKQTGVLPIVYTPFDLGSAVEGCLIWRPRYNNANKEPVLRWDIWQFSNGVYGNPRSVPGFGNVDINTVRAGIKLSDLLIP